MDTDDLLFKKKLLTTDIPLIIPESIEKQNFRCMINVIIVLICLILIVFYMNYTSYDNSPTKFAMHNFI